MKQVSVQIKVQYNNLIILNLLATIQTFYQSENKAQVSTSSITNSVFFQLEREKGEDNREGR